jgi:hypothetical protein
MASLCGLMRGFFEDGFIVLRRFLGDIRLSVHLESYHFSELQGQMWWSQAAYDSPQHTPDEFSHPYRLVLPTQWGERGQVFHSAAKLPCQARAHSIGLRFVWMQRFVGLSCLACLAKRYR